MTKFYCHFHSDLHLGEFCHQIKDYCDGLQLYVTHVLPESLKQVRETKALLDQCGLKCLIHLDSDYTFHDLEAARILAGDFGIYVIHFSGSSSISPIPWGIIGLENERFTLDQEYHNLWLTESRRLGRMPVFDVPRLFRDQQFANAVSEAERIFSLLDNYVVHLIDFNDLHQERKDFVPLGSGLLSPWLSTLTLPVLPKIVVLEFENIKHSIESMEFVRKVFC